MVIRVSGEGFWIRESQTEMMKRRIWR